MRIGAETHVVAAYYYLARFFDIPADQSALHDWTWESVYENGVDESGEDDAYEVVAESLRLQYQHQPNRCLEILGHMVGSRTQEIIGAVEQFIRRTMA